MSDYISRAEQTEVVHYRSHPFLEEKVVPESAFNQGTFTESAETGQGSLSPENEEMSLILESGNLRKICSTMMAGVESSFENDGGLMKVTEISAIAIQELREIWKYIEAKPMPFDLETMKMVEEFKRKALAVVRATGKDIADIKDPGDQMAAARQIAHSIRSNIPASDVKTESLVWQNFINQMPSENPAREVLESTLTHGDLLKEQELRRRREEQQGLMMTFLHAKGRAATVRKSGRS